MKYYIKVSNWELIDILINDRIDVQKEFNNSIILSTEEWDSEYSIVIDEKLLDKSYLKPLKDNLFFTPDENTNYSEYFSYYKNIHIFTGFVSFIFSTEKALENIKSSTNIILDAKGVEKYYPYFIVRDSNKFIIKNDAIEKQFSPNYKYQKETEYINRIKGAITAYAKVLAFSSNNHIVEFSNKVKNLKDLFLSLHSKLMISEKRLLDNDIFNTIEKYRNEYHQLFGNSNPNLDVILSITKEISNISIQRERLPYIDIDRKKLELSNIIKDIEDKYGISELRDELKHIKDEEKRIGQNKGKSRVYFKKDTYEYKRKAFIKTELEIFEKDNQEYRDAKNKIWSINRISEERDSYNSAINSLFIRLSDLCNLIIDDISKQSQINENIDLSNIKITSDKEFIIIDSNICEEEIIYFNIILNLILENSSMDISEQNILKIIRMSANIFNSYQETTKSKQIKDSINAYYLYKTNKIPIFNIPKELPLISAIIAFFLKPFSFEQIDRYMQSKGLELSQYAYALYGAYNGYSKIPKNLTNNLYKNKNIVEYIEKFIFDILYN